MGMESCFAGCANPIQLFAWLSLQNQVSLQHGLQSWGAMQVKSYSVLPAGPEGASRCKHQRAQPKRQLELLALMRFSPIAVVTLPNCHYAVHPHLEVCAELLLAMAAKDHHEQMA